jgi:hypothetical protein
MTIQNYLVIENNVVNNIILWDGDTNTWQPPESATMLVEATTPAYVWDLYIDNEDWSKTDWFLIEIMGDCSVGFTWNGTACTTNQPKPPIPPQPI